MCLFTGMRYWEEGWDWFVCLFTGKRYWDEVPQRGRDWSLRLFTGIRREGTGLRVY